MRSLKQYPFVAANAGVNWQDVDPRILSDLNALGRARGEVVTLTSGKRTYEQQAALYARYKASGFNIKYIAAKPGQSNHESGAAVDATIGGVPLARAVKASELAGYGLVSPVKGDPVHTELLGSAIPADTAPARVAPTADTAAPDPAVQILPRVGTPPASVDPSVEMPGTAQHYLPGQGGVADSWQSIMQLPDLSPDTGRLAQLSSGG